MIPSKSVIPLALTAPLLSPYGTFQGSLFQYSRNLVAFESAGHPNTEYNKKACILIGGLSDGLIPTPYAKPLEKQCQELGWSLIQPIFSSSYLGFGNGDLERDTKELSELITYLICHRGAQEVALIGHSTGCQNSVHFLKYGPTSLIQRVKIVVLQAPVSDRESIRMESSYERNIEYARGLRKSGQEMEYMPRSAFWAPITAKRFLDLHDRDGADDYFSSDLTDTELIERLGHIGQLVDKALVVFSGSDEYVPSEVDSFVLTQRLVAAMNSHVAKSVAEALYLASANHNLSEGLGDLELFLNEVYRVLKD